MSKSKKSIISISSLFLTNLTFHKKAVKLKRIVIPSRSINIEASIEELEQLVYLTRCSIIINSEENPNADFVSILKYEVISQTVDIDHLKDLVSFAKFGAIFNVFVHARELIADLTARSFGKAALFPLLDIRQLGNEIKIATHISHQETIKDDAMTTKPQANL